jgi:hypothetical protein
MSETPAPAIAVVGMHRSGTSCLAGCLEDCGLHLGAVNRAAEYNRKGNNENEALRAVHEAIFARIGASWDRPPPTPVVWTRDERAAVRALLAGYAGSPAWGFKDPRSLFLLDGWFELLPELRLVGTFRHPLEVAASLAHRDHFDPGRALALWAAYNQALLDWRGRIRFPVIFYDADAPRYLAEVRAAAAALGLNAAADIAFREESLNHNVATSAPPGNLAPLWDRLHAARTAAG